MFSKELENLIEATLMDGRLEENEKAALVKRAQREGVDLDELEIYIQSILQKRKQEQNKAENAKQEEIDQRKKEALGRICPQCHQPVPPLAVKCACGYEFQSHDSLSSVKVLMEKIEKIEAREIDMSGFDDATKAKRMREQKDQKAKEIINVITLFPVPNNKEDIIEFCSLSASLAMNKKHFLLTRDGFILILAGVVLIAALISWIAGGEGIFAVPVLVFGVMPILLIYAMNQNDAGRANKIANAWKSKLNQVLLKGRSFRGDPEFTQQLDYYDNLINPKKS
ncbi:MAG: hypothetical protein IJV08_00860 [Bacteroidaceae bacterium]|nr:hypothetical protein [Bacteroidaceae bacterium]